jgi:hypothetical protein
MRTRRKHRRSLAVAFGFAGVIAMPLVAAAQTKIYPPGTDCANLPTIAERLLCGRQEFRRQQGISVEQPTIVPQGSVPGTADEPEPFPQQPMPQPELRLVPGQQERMQPNTASPNH